MAWLCVALISPSKLCVAFLHNEISGTLVQSNRSIYFYFFLVKVKSIGAAHTHEHIDNEKFEHETRTSSA